MRQIILLLLLFSCGRHQNDKSNLTTDKTNNDFYSLLEQLPNLKTPLTFRSNRQISRDNLINEELINRIHESDPSFNPYGRIYQTSDFIAVIGIGSADIATPVLATYDKNGKLIDSFFMYPTAGGDMGYYSTNIITLTENKELFLTDSVLTRKINKEGTDEIPGTDSLSATTKKNFIKEYTFVRNQNKPLTT